MKKLLLLLPLIACFFVSCNQQAKVPAETTVARIDTSAIHFMGENHLKNVRQLTFGGENAEAYWSFNNRMLTYQYRNKGKGNMCDQIFMGDIASFLQEDSL